MRCFIFAVVLVASTAHADSVADEADVAFELGNRDYRRGDFQAALDHYFVSYRLVPNHNVLFNVARCYEQLHRYDEAYRYYRELKQSRLSARDDRDVQGALVRLQPRVALLEIASEPPGADVFVDREELGSRGQTPLTLALPPGAHALTVKAIGFRSRQMPVRLERGHRVQVTAPLERILGTLRLVGTPSGAAVRDSGGAELGRLPATLSLEPGQRLLTVSANGFVSRQLLIDVPADAQREVRVSLDSAPAATGKVVVMSNRDRALVRVDGREAGFTPAVLTLSEGEHQLEVSTSEVRAFATRIVVRRDSEQELFAELHYQPPPIRAASKGLESIDDAPASVSVITAEELRSFGYATLAEALQAISGFFLLDDRQYPHVGTRGFLPSGDLNTRMLVLWDGHAMNDVWAGQGYVGRDLNVDLEAVERIEIVRGPGSALWGTGAVFAVINVIPRSRLETGESAEALGAVGSLGLTRGRLTGAWSNANASVFATGAAFRAKGADVTDLGSMGLVQGLDSESGWNASAQARFGRWTLSALLNSRDRELPTAPFGTQVNAPGTRISDQRGFVELKLEQPLGPGSLFARAYYDASRYNGTWVYQPPEGTEFDSGGADWVGAEAQLRAPLPAANALTAGVEAQQQLRVFQGVFGPQNGPPLETRTRTVLSAYAQDVFSLLPRVKLFLGARVDHYSDLDVVPVSPRLAIILKPYEAGVTKLVAGTAFRAPNVYELYYQDYGVTQLPALKLNPETIATLEIEHSHDMSRELRLRADVYANWISQLIALESENAAQPRCGDASTPLQCLVNQNSPATTRALGAEVELRWQPGRFALVDLSYSFASLTHALADTEKLMPQHVLAGRIMVPVTAGLRLSGQAVYQSARGGFAESDVLLINAGVSGELPHLRYFAGVNNALDSRYALPSSGTGGLSLVPQYGRTFLVQLAGSF